MTGVITARVIILLPARDEEEGIGEVIDRIPSAEIAEMGFTPQIVVVDGNSTDSTREISLNRGARLIVQTGNEGKGSGVREALDEIFNDQDSAGEDIIVMLDADATYSPEDLPRFIECLKEHDVVWGSRIRGGIEKGAMSMTNNIGNRILSLSASILFMKRTTDLCTGYWGFRSETLKGLMLTASGFNLEADLFCSVAKSRAKTIEIPIGYANREGESNLKWYKDGPAIFLMTLKKRLSRN